MANPRTPSSGKKKPSSIYTSGIVKPKLPMSALTIGSGAKASRCAIKKSQLLVALKDLKEATTVTEVISSGRKVKKLIREYRSSCECV
jgi:hypothetical protein